MTHRKGGDGLKIGASLDSLASRLSLVIAVVTHHFAAFNSYRVKISDGDEIIATPVLGTGGGVLGTRDHPTFFIGSLVVVGIIKDQDQSSAYGLIFGSIPKEVSNEAYYQADADVYGANVGWLVDKMHTYEMTQRSEESQRKNFNNFTPIDALSGEWGQYSPLGPAVHVGILEAYLRASEKCGVYLLKQDDLLREVARSLERYTYSEEYGDYSFAGELHTCASRAMYPWEGLGAFDPDTAIAAIDDESAYSEDATDLSLPISTNVEDIRGIFRHRRVTGYSGDFDQEFLAVPIKSSDLDSYDNEDNKFPGVYRRVLGSDGSFLLQSAKSIAIEKTIAIPYPIEKKKPFDPNGDFSPDEDGEGSYLASGYYRVKKDKEDTPDAHYRSDYKFEKDAETPRARGMLGLELHSQMAIATITNLLLHKDNWRVPQESDCPLLDEDQPSINIGTEFQLDDTRQFMPLPRKKSIDVDHRFKEVDYYASKAGFYLLDDGTVVITDGYGSQIVMTGGNIYKSCANDIIDISGRSKVSMAPKDIVQKAGRDVDITSSYGDVRLKAEYNLIGIGGNDGQKGGVLVESRNNDSYGEFDYTPGSESNIGGVVIANQKGNVSIVAHDIIGYAGYYDQDSTSKIIMQSYGDSYYRSNSIQMDIVSELSIAVGTRAVDEGDEDFSTRSLYRITTSGLDIVGNSTTEAGLHVNGSITVGSFVSANSVSTVGGSVGQLSGDALENSVSDKEDVVFESGDAIYNRLIDAKRTSREGTSSNLTNYFNPESVSGIAGSLRGEEDYQTTTEDMFTLFTFEWQQMAEYSDTDSSGRWIEPSVDYVVGSSPRKTYPWPGKDPWSSQARLLVLKEGTTRYFNGTRTRDFDQEIDLEDGLKSEIDKATLETSFVVNYQPIRRT